SRSAGTSKQQWRSMECCHTRYYEYGPMLRLCELSEQQHRFVWYILAKDCLSGASPSKELPTQVHARTW
ncbi:MAG: hypothetical protein ACKN81_16415, partial [Pirellulaceae bacterium]